MAKLLSNKVKKISSDQVDPNRYQYLSLENAEPDLGVASITGQILTSSNTGERSWTSNVELDYANVSVLFANTLITESLKFPDGGGSTGQVLTTDGFGNLYFETLTLQIITDAGNVTNNDIIINANLQATELSGGGAGITSVDAITLDGENKSYFTTYADLAADTAYSNSITYTDQQISALVNSAPAVLDTLNELANAINNDESFATTVANQISTAYSNAIAQIGQGNVTISAGGGLSGTGTLNVNQFSDLTITIEHGNTSSQSNVDNDAGNVIQDIYVDEYGHITSIASANLDFRYLQQETDTLESVTDRGNVTNNSIISLANVQGEYLVGNGNFITSVNADLLDGQNGNYYTEYAANVAETAYSNATAFAANVADTAYSNAVSYADAEIAIAANAAYTNAVSYTDSEITLLYGNVTSYADAGDATTYSNAVSYADAEIAIAANAAYSNAVSYADAEIAIAANAAYSNAVAQIGNGAILVANGSGISGNGSFTVNSFSNLSITISHADTSSVANVDSSGGVVVQDLSFDEFGHVQTVGTIDLDARYLQSFTETDTLNSVVLRGATTNSAITVANTITANVVTGLSLPTNSTDAANKAYVDEVAEGLAIRGSVEVITLTNLDAVYDNGNNGIGSTLTSSANTEWPEIDGYLITSTTPGENGVLVAGQANAAHNGRYNVIDLGSNTSPWILQRCGACDEADEIPGSFVFIKHGDTYAGTGWVQTVADAAIFVIGTDDIFVTQFSQAGVYTANAGLILDGLDFRVDANIAGQYLSYMSGVLNVNASTSDVADVLVSRDANGDIFANTFHGDGSSLDNVDAVSLNGQNASYYLDYNNFVNTPNSAVEILSSAATVDFDFSNTINFNVTLTQNTTFTFSNLASAPGQTGLLVINQDGIGGHEFTLPAEAKTPVGGAVIDQVTTAATSSVMNYFVVNSAAVFVNYIGDFQ